MANNNLFAGIYAGLTSTYSQLAAQNPNGLTLENLVSSRNDTKTNTTLNQSFASYLQNNFTSIDKNGDGILTEDEMSNLTNMMSRQGLTRDELIQMYASGTSGLSQETMNKILEHFDEMDANHDGRITSAEISAFDLSASRMEKEDEFNNRRASDMSVFYGSDSSGSDTYSLLSYKYKNNKS